MVADNSIVKKMTVASKLLLVAVIAVNVGVLISWFFFTPVIPGALEMNPLTSVNFVFFSVSFLMLIHLNAGVLLQRVALGLLAWVVFTSSYAFINRLVPFSFHIDGILFSGQFLNKVSFRLPKDMAASTCICFLVLSFCLYLMKYKPLKAMRFQLPVVVVIAIATYTVIGYLYKIPEVSVTYLYLMSFLAALCFYSLSFSLLMARPENGMMLQLSSPYTGSQVLRYLAPASIFVPIVIGYLRLYGNWYKIFSTEMGVALLVLSVIVLFMSLVWRTAVQFNRKDVAEKEVVQRTSALNKKLQEANEETAALNEELLASNEELISNNEELNVINEQLSVANLQLEKANGIIAKQKDEQLNRVLDSTNDVIWSYDLTGSNHNYLSRSAERVYGEPYEKLVNEPYFWLRFVHPEDRAIKNESQERLNKFGFTECSYRIVTPAGIRWINDRIRITKDGAGRLISLEGIAVDITSLKEAEQELVRERNFLSILIESIPDPIFVRDKNLKTIIHNKASLDLLQFSDPSFTKGKDVSEYMVDKELGVSAFAREKKILETGKADINNEQVVAIGGQKRIFLVTTVPLLEKNNKIAGLLGVSRDITVAREQQQELEDYRKKLDIVFQNSTDTFLLIDAEAKVVLFNHPFVLYAREVMGVDVKIGMDFMDVVPPNRQLPARELLKRAYNGESIQLELEAHFASGVKHYNTRYSPVLKDGKVIYVTIASTDITERKTQEFITNQYRENLDIIFKSTTDTFLLISAQKKVVMFNRAFEKFIGDVYGAHPRIGMDFLEVVSPHRKTVAEEYFAKALQGKISEVESEFISRSGEKVFHLIKYEPVVTGGAVSHVCISATDVTGLRKMRDELIRDQSFLAKASESAKIGYWTSEPDLADGNITWSKELFKIFEIDEKEFTGKMSFFHQFVHSEDRALLAKTAVNALEFSKPYNVDHRIVLRDGRVKWVNENAHLIRDEKGRVERLVGITQDITDRRKSEDELRQSQFFLEKSSEAARIGYWTSELENDGGKLVWSDAVFEIFEVDKKEFDGVNNFFFSRIYPDDKETVLKSAKKAQLEGSVYDVDHRIILKNGKTKWVNERGQVITMSGSPIMVGIVQDINDRKKIEEVLREYNDRFEILSRATNDVIWDWDIPRNHIQYNHGIETVLGYNLMSLRPDSTWWEERVHPDDKSKIAEDLKRSFDEGHSVWEMHYRFLAADGNYRYIHDRASIVYDSTNRAIRVIGAMQDVTQQKDYEKKLQLAVHEIADLIENANVPVMGFDKNYCITEWNQTSASLIGYSKDEVLGKNILASIFAVADLPRITRMLSIALNGDPVSNFEVLTQSEDGSKAVLLMNASPRRMFSEETQQAIIVAQNITELSEYRTNLEKIIEERTKELNSALRKEKETIEMQKRFVSMASHEFRTPLSSITLSSGFLRKFKKQLGPDKLDEKLINIENQVKHMTHLLDNVLTVGKSDAGKIPVTFAELNLKTTFAVLAQEVMASSRNSHWINLTFDVTRDTFVSDEGLIRNIAINLLTNAIKFSPSADEVTFAIGCDESKVSLLVRDFGLGIPKEDLGRLFEPFFRAGNIKAISGTGLGLSIVKRAVELLNGTISVTSEIGRGTEFLIILPHAKDEV